MQFTKTISVRIRGEAESEREFDRSIADYLGTIEDMANVYREGDHEVDVRVGDNEEQKWGCNHCRWWYFGTRAAGAQVLPCRRSGSHDRRPIDG